MIGLLFIKKIEPVLRKLEKYIEYKGVQIATYVLLVFMIFNFGISFLAGKRQKERLTNISAKNSLEIFLDNTYPDYRLNKIYGNKITKYNIK